MAIDRQNRNLLVEAIDSYVTDRISAFDFDEAIFKIDDATTDITIHAVVADLWCLYDDCVDHPVVMSREMWNYVQRLRLLLLSDAAMESRSYWAWSGSQAVAALLFILWAWAACATAFGWDLILVNIFLGAMSIGLSVWRSDLQKNWDVTLAPFDSFSQLLGTRRGVAQFRKERYPSRLILRRISGPFGELWRLGYVYVCWLLFSPVVLFAQILPVSIPVRRVIPTV